jgi:protein-tyrosine phosphatase
MVLMTGSGQLRRYNFAPADSDNQVVFGSCRPGFPGKQVDPSEVDDWIDFMAGESIRRVVCLLPNAQLKYYRRLRGGLLAKYRSAFGAVNVLHAPIRDYHLSTAENLSQILAFLHDSVDRAEPTVVHCSGGSGRTGHVLAAWLVVERGLDPRPALAAIRQTGRDPYEALAAGYATESELIALLEPCRTP